MPDVTTAAAPSSDVPLKVQKDLAAKRAEIRAAQQFMQKEKLHETWRNLIDAYGKNAKATSQRRHKIDVPISFANVNVIRSALTVSNPRFSVNARTEESYSSGLIAEAVLNYEWRRRNHQDQVRLAVNDSLIIGHGWLKAGYRLSAVEGTTDLNLPQTQIQTLAEEGFSTDFDEAYAKSRSQLTARAARGDLVDVPSRQEAARQVREEGGILLEDHSTLERVSPFDMLIDPTATHLHNAQWIAQRVPVRSDVAKNDRRWPNKVRQQLAPGRRSIAEGEDTGEKGRLNQTFPENNSKVPYGSDDQIEWVIIWEFYDLHTGEWCIFDDGAADDFLVRPEEMPHISGHPFIYGGNYDVPDQLYPLGELERIFPLQEELNETRSDLINARRTHRNKYVADSKLLAESGEQSLREVLTSDEDNLIAAVDLEPGQNLQDMVHRLPTTQVDPDLYNVSSTIINDINEVTGVTEFQRGGSSLGASTATEAAIINDGAQARMREKQGLVEKMMRESARKLVSLMQQYQRQRKTLRIAVGDPEGARFFEGLRRLGYENENEIEFLQYGPEEIRGEFDLEIQPGSSTAHNETQKRRAANELLAGVLTLMQGFPQAAERIDVTALLDYYFRHGFDIPNSAQFLLPERNSAQSGGVPGFGQGQAEGSGPPGLRSVPGGIQQPGGGPPESASAPPAATNLLGSSPFVG